MILVVQLPNISDVPTDVFLMVLSLVRFRELSILGFVPHPVVVLGPFASWVEVVLEETDLRIVIKDLLSLCIRQ
jgi:hypothetical protein